MSEPSDITTGAGAGADHCPALSPESISTTFLTPGSPGLHPLLKRLRDEAPVFFSEELGTWVVTRYDDVAGILKDAELFPSSTRSFILAGVPAEVREVLEDTCTFTAPNMGFDGSPVHERLRRPVTQYFSHRGVARLESRITGIAERHVRAFPAEPPADLVEAYARPLSADIVIELAGLPAADHDRILRYHRALNDFFFGQPPEHLQLGYAKDVKEWEGYLAGVIAERRRAPRDDLISLLTRKVARGEAQYSDEELISFFSFDIVTAGIRPTGFALVNLCNELLSEPERWESLREEPARFDGLFHETLRRSGLALGVFRKTAADAQVGGVAIPAGAAVWALTASANRDERHFPHPDAFDPHRPLLGSSLHFSQGLHYCLGVNLARMVTRAGLTALMRHRPGLRLVRGQERVYEPGINVIAPARLLLEW